VSGLPPLPGDPDAVRLLADRLVATAQRLSALSAVLARLRDGATWEGPAGEAFGARLHGVAPVLDAVSTRLGGAAPALRGLAEAMDQAQAVVAGAVLDVDEAEHAYAVLEDRAAALVAVGATESDADLLVLRHLQREQVEAGQVARARHAAASERFREADARCATVLRHLSVDGLADSLPYRLVAGVSGVGHDIATAGLLVPVAPELKPVAAAADALALGADATLLVAFGEGDAGQLATGAALTALGVSGGVLRSGATAGAQRTAGGVVVSTVRLTTQQRLALGVVGQARARRDALRASFRVPPGRGTSSALLGGPAPRPQRWGGAVTLTGLAARVGSGTRQTGRAARVAARARADRLFLDDWRLATANGPQAQRMYIAGATLEVGAAASGRAHAAGRPEGGGNVR